MAAGDGKIKQMNKYSIILSTIFAIFFLAVTFIIFVVIALAISGRIESGIMAALVLLLIVIIGTSVAVLPLFLISKKLGKKKAKELYKRIGISFLNLLLGLFIFILLSMSGLFSNDAGLIIAVAYCLLAAGLAFLPVISYAKINDR